ncbi:MAG: hypothetical protein AAF581_08375 [Planctomycetota bacterium]
MKCTAHGAHELTTTGPQLKSGRTLLQALVVLAAFLVFTSAPLAIADGEKPKATIIDPTKVYLGKPQSFKKPAIVHFAKVTPFIPEYRKIKEEGLKPTDAEYQILAQEGSKRFRRTVKAVAKKKGFDLVAEHNAVLPPPGTVLTDLTKEVVKKLGGTL